MLRYSRQRGGEIMDSKEMLNYFCKNILYLRKQYGYTQKKMAYIMGISVSSLRKLERGIMPRCITAKTLYNLCRHFQISADFLLSEEIINISTGAGAPKAPLCKGSCQKQFFETAFD